MRLSLKPIKASPMIKTQNQIYLIQKAQRVIRKNRVQMRVMTNAKRIYQQAESALTSCVLLKKSIKRLGQELNKTNIAFSAKTAMRTTTTIFIVSFVSKYIQITAKTRTMINGSAVTIANVG